MNKDNIVPGIYDNQFKNMNETLIQKLTDRYPNPDENMLELWDKRYLYGLHHFPDFACPQVSTLTHKILERKRWPNIHRKDS